MRTGFTVPEIARLYDFPTELDGKGQCIGLIELGGGYKDSDLDVYFQRLKLPRPNITWVGVGGAKNQPVGEPKSADGQVMMDLEIAGAVAHGAHLVVYFGPADDRGYIDAIKTAVADEVNRPSVISISWEQAESGWKPDALMQINQAFQAASNRNITVLAAAGDQGATDGVLDGHAHVDFPASSPWVLAVGGTSISVSTGAITSETVWNGGPTVAQLAAV